MQFDFSSSQLIFFFYSRGLPHNRAGGHDRWRLYCLTNKSMSDLPNYFKQAGTFEERELGSVLQKNPT
jgi:hypothetical protein